MFGNSWLVSRIVCCSWCSWCSKHPYPYLWHTAQNHNVWNYTINKRGPFLVRNISSCRDYNCCEHTFVRCTEVYPPVSPSSCDWTHVPTLPERNHTRAVASLAFVGWHSLVYLCLCYKSGPYNPDKTALLFVPSGRKERANHHSVPPPQRSRSDYESERYRFADRTKNLTDADWMYSKAAGTWKTKGNFWSFLLHATHCKSYTNRLFLLYLLIKI